MQDPPKGANDEPAITTWDEDDREQAASLEVPVPDRVRFLDFGEPDPYSRLRVGTEGTVSTVDDIGTVHVNWDDGGRLGMVVAAPPGQQPDRIELVRS
jgi:hypothetical protein